MQKTRDESGSNKKTTVILGFGMDSLRVRPFSAGVSNCIVQFLHAKEIESTTFPKVLTQYLD